MNNRTPLEFFKALFARWIEVKEVSLNLLKLALVWAIAVFLVASCGCSAYANDVHQKADELALVGYQSLAHIPRFNAVFLCVLSTHSRFMVKLEGDAFARAGDLENQSTNPFKLCHPYLVVNGRASINSLGAH